VIRDEVNASAGAADTSDDFFHRVHFGTLIGPGMTQQHLRSAPWRMFWNIPCESLMFQRVVFSSDHAACTVAAPPTRPPVGAAVLGAGAPGTDRPPACYLSLTMPLQSEIRRDGTGD
jgi:hypothetical protein